MKNPLVVWAGDLHFNSTVAPCVPEFEKDDGDYHKNSKTQDALWEMWKDAWKQVAHLSKGRDVVTILGGEIADQMQKHPTFQYVTHNPDTIRRLALETLEPALAVTNYLIVLRGTEAHVGTGSNLDEGIAREIAKSRDWSDVKVIKDGVRYSHYYATYYIGGRFFDMTHHVNMGSSKRTERDAANHLAADLIMDYTRVWSDNRQRRFELPDFALRGHVHRFSDSKDNYPIRAVICPAWQVHTSFSYRISAGASKNDVGLVVIDPAKNQVDWIKYRTKPRDTKVL